MDTIKKIVSQYLNVENNRLKGDGYTHEQEHSALMDLETKTYSLMHKGKTEEVRHLAYLLHKNIKAKRACVGKLIGKEI